MNIQGLLVPSKLSLRFTPQEYAYLSIHCRGVQPWECRQGIMHWFQIHLGIVCCSPLQASKVSEDEIFLRRAISYGRLSLKAALVPFRELPKQKLRLEYSGFVFYASANSQEIVLLYGTKSASSLGSRQTGTAAEVQPCIDCRICCHEASQGPWRISSSRKTPNLTSSSVSTWLSRPSRTFFGMPSIFLEAIYSWNCNLPFFSDCRVSVSLDSEPLDFFLAVASLSSTSLPPRSTAIWWFLLPLHFRLPVFCLVWLPALSLSALDRFWMASGVWKLVNSPRGLNEWTC